MNVGRACGPADCNMQKKLTSTRLSEFEEIASVKLSNLIGGSYANSNKLGSCISLEDKMINANTKYTYFTLREKPELKDTAAVWFHTKWGVPKEAYLECIY